MKLTTQLRGAALGTMLMLAPTLPGEKVMAEEAAPVGGSKKAAVVVVKDSGKIGVQLAANNTKPASPGVTEAPVVDTQPTAKYVATVEKGYEKKLISKDDRDYLIKNNWEIGAGGKTIGNLFALFQHLTDGYTARSLKDYSVDIAPVYNLKTDQSVLSTFIHTKNPEIGFKLAKLAGYAVLRDGGAGEYRHILDKETIAQLVEQATKYDGTAESFFATNVNHLVKARLDIFTDQGFIGAQSVEFHLKSLIGSGLPVLAKLK